MSIQETSLGPMTPLTRRRFLEHLGIWIASVPALGHTEVLNGFIEQDLSDQQGLRSFAYYQGLSASETRSPSRTDGTYSNMPCISWQDIEAGLPLTYTFWHGHNGLSHEFSLTEEHFATLQKGQSIEILTSMISGHRHALRIDPSDFCLALE